MENTPFQIIVNLLPPIFGGISGCDNIQMLKRRKLSEIKEFLNLCGCFVHFVHKVAGNFLLRGRRDRKKAFLYHNDKHHRKELLSCQDILMSWSMAFRSVSEKKAST